MLSAVCLAGREIQAVCYKASPVWLHEHLLCVKNNAVKCKHICICIHSTAFRIGRSGSISILRKTQCGEKMAPPAKNTNDNDKEICTLVSRYISGSAISLVKAHSQWLCKLIQCINS